MNKNIYINENIIKEKDIKSITIIGTLWFDGYNASLSSVCLINGKVYIKIPNKFGGLYDDNYIYNMFKILKNNNIINIKVDHTAVQYCEDNNIKYYFHCIEVARKKDLL